MSAPVIISEIRPSRLEPISPAVSEVYMGMDFGAGDSCTQLQQVQLEKPCKPCKEAELDILKMRVGDVMPMSSVPELKIEKIDTAGQGPQDAECISDATQRILDACAEASSRWFSAMRSCIRRDRVRQALFREEHGLPNSAKIPYERQPLTATEEATASMAEATIRCLFGDYVANYAREKFDHAIDTGDMRAFKIRLLVIKARDFLHKEKSPMHQEFVKGMENCIEKAERLAGCIPDPSPRRLSRAEQERKRKREEEKAKHRELHSELPLESPEQSSDVPIAQDIEQYASGKYTDDSSPKCPQKNVEYSISKKKEKQNDKVSPSGDNRDIDTATVAVAITDGKKLNGLAKSGIVRKAREYDTVEQILDDIENGKIVPYESSDEICADLKAGLLTPVEALMFTSALDRYSPQDVDLDDAQRNDLEMENVGVDEEVDEEEVDDGEVDDGTSFSYNPKGFAGGFGDQEYPDDWE